MKDPIVEEVREARKKHAELFNFDLHEICKDLKKKEKTLRNPIKSLPPKLLLKKTGS
jgi:ParB-like chromosome segregation protein Spo0J